MTKRIFILAAAVALFLSPPWLSSASAADWMAYEIRCEQQYTDAELPDLIWSQGSTPLIAARTYERGKAVPPRDDVTVQMMIAPSATSQYWAVVSNQTTDATSYLLQWPTIGTNTTAKAPWYYVLYFLRDGRRYWTGSGNLWIEETTATGDGLVWQEIIGYDLATLTNDLATLWGELQGPAWLTPARFDWEASVDTTATTNVGPETDGGWAVLTRVREVVTEKEYILHPAIMRNQWGAKMVATVDGPATLEPIGNGDSLLQWDDTAELGDTATVSGQLGDWRSDTVVELTEAGNVQTQKFFSSFATGGIRETFADVLARWTNSTAWNHRFANYGAPSMTNWEARTNGYRLTTNWWADGADLSGVSFLNDHPAWYYTTIGTLVASNLVYGAAHWTRYTGAHLCWMGKDGQPHASQIVDQRRMNYDLCLSKISPPLDPEVCTPYPILQINPAMQHTDTGDSRVQGVPPLPLLAMSQSQVAWIMAGGARGFEGYVGGIFDHATGEYIKNSRQCAVGGDSGSPCFATVDGTNLVLVGSYFTAYGLSLPGGEMQRPLILDAAASMGADPDAIQWQTWAGWPTYLGPLNP